MWKDPKVILYKSNFAYMFLKPFSKFKNSRPFICVSFLINAENISLPIIHLSIYVYIHSSIHSSVRNFIYATFFG